MSPQRNGGWPVRVVSCVPAGLEALHGRARLSCHRWSTAARVVASVAHPRACLHMRLTASRGTHSGWLEVAAARWWMAWRSAALGASWPGCAPWSCPTVLPSVEHGSTRGGFGCAPTCMPAHAADGLSRHTQWLVGGCRSAMVDGLEECCAWCQLAWMRSMVMPDCPAIGGARQHAWWLRLRTHVHAWTCG